MAEKDQDHPLPLDKERIQRLGAGYGLDFVRHPHFGYTILTDSKNSSLIIILDKEQYEARKETYSQDIAETLITAITSFDTTTVSEWQEIELPSNNFDPSWVVYALEVGFPPDRDTLRLALNTAHYAVENETMLRQVIPEREEGVSKIKPVDILTMQRDTGFFVDVCQQNGLPCVMVAIDAKHMIIEAILDWDGPRQKLERFIATMINTNEQISVYPLTFHRQADLTTYETSDLELHIAQQPRPEDVPRSTRPFLVFYFSIKDDIPLPLHQAWRIAKDLKERLKTAPQIYGDMYSLNYRDFINVSDKDLLKFYEKTLGLSEEDKLDATFEQLEMWDIDTEFDEDEDSEDDDDYEEEDEDGDE